MTTPERWVGGILLRADFRAFHAMELAWDAPLGVLLGEALGSATSLHRLAWCLASTWREAHPTMTLEEFLDLLPADLADLGTTSLRLIDEAVTPLVPVDDTGRTREPERVRWTQLLFEGTHLLGMSQSEWWLSTFRTHGALIWEMARYNDPEGKSGRPMAQWEIDEINRVNMTRLLGMGATRGLETVRSSTT